MKNKISLMICVVGLFLLIATSCSTNEKASGIAKVKVIAKSNQSGLSEAARVSGEGDSISFSEVMMGVTELSFEKKYESEDEGEDGNHDGDQNEDQNENENDDEGNGGSFEFSGNYIVDLVRGTSTPDFGIEQVTPGTYSEIEMEVAPILSDGNSIFIRASYFDSGGHEYTVEYSNKTKVEIEVEGETEINSSISNLLVVLRMDRLFEGIDLSQATMDDDHVIRINADSNAAIAEQIANNFDQSIECGHDKDGDEEIDEHGDDNGEDGD